MANKSSDKDKDKSREDAKNIAKLVNSAKTGDDKGFNSALSGLGVQKVNGIYVDKDGNPI